MTHYAQRTRGDPTVHNLFRQTQIALGCMHTDLSLFSLDVGTQFTFGTCPQDYQ